MPVRSKPHGNRGQANECGRKPVSPHLNAILSRLKGVKRSGAAWTAICPAHDDHNPSLSVGTGDEERILVKCHAGCRAESIVEAIGLTMADLFPPRDGCKRGTNPRIVAAYDYGDESGKLLFQCVRYEPKAFRQRRPDLNVPDQWIWNLDGVRRVLYRLPEVLAALSTGQTIFIAEGEKDCDTLVTHGFPATCNPMGAGKWLPEHAETLRDDASIVVLADKDEPGRKHARAVASSLIRHVKSLKLIELPDLEGKPVKDVSDWFAAGGTPASLRDIIETAQEFTTPSASPACGTNSDTSEAKSPNAWFKDRFPKLAERHGEPVLETQGKKAELPRVVDVCEDFIAATLGEDGQPEAPTVFLPVEERFYAYDPSHGIFVHRRESELSAQISRLFLMCARECQDSCDVSKLEFGLRDTSALTGILRRARGLLAEDGECFKVDGMEFIAVANGMLRLTDRTLLPFSPAYRRRNKLAVAFNPDARCPMFLETLMYPALEDADIRLLQRWCGLALLGENLAQRLLLLTGTAGGGKGVLVRVVCGIIGEKNLASLRTALLAERFELGRYMGRTLLYGADVPNDFLNQKSAGVLRALTGGDPVTVELKNSNEVPSITCRFNVIITSNSRLTVHLEGDTDAWRRRLAVVRYTRPKPVRVIPDLSERILRDEGPGVLNWMLDGLDQLRADDWQLLLDERQQRIVDDLLHESESHREFVRRCLIKGSGATLLLNDAFGAYVDFCSEHGWGAISRHQFGRLIPDAVVQEHRVILRRDIKDPAGKDQQGWKGLRLTCSSKWSENKASEPSAHPDRMNDSEGSEGFFPCRASKEAHQPELSVSLGNP